MFRTGWNLRDRPNVFFTMYEEMSDDLRCVATRLIKFLGKGEKQVIGILDGPIRKRSTKEAKAIISMKSVHLKISINWIMEVSYTTNKMILVAMTGFYFAVVVTIKLTFGSSY